MIHAILNHDRYIHWISKHKILTINEKSMVSTGFINFVKVTWTIITGNDRIRNVMVWRLFNFVKPHRRLTRENQSNFCYNLLSDVSNETENLKKKSTSASAIRLFIFFTYLTHLMIKKYFLAKVIIKQGKEFHGKHQSKISFMFVPTTHNNNVLHNKTLWRNIGKAQEKHKRGQKSKNQKICYPYTISWHRGRTEWDKQGINV